MFGPKWAPDWKKPTVKGHSWNNMGNLKIDWILKDIKELLLNFKYG